MDNVLTLAYLGDAVYEVYVREYLISSGIVNIDLLQKSSLKYVSAKGQRVFLDYLINNNILYDDEIDLVKRGRNNKRKVHPKNTDIITYKYATGLECLVGYLYLNNKDRLYCILSYLEVI